MKKTVSLVLAVIMALSIFAFAPVTKILAEENTVIKSNSPAITGNVGEEIDLSTYSVELKDGAVLTDPQWTQDGNTVTKVKFDGKGVYPLVASDGDNSKTVYAVIKEADETEYVLYENSFDKDIEDCKKVANGNVYVEDGTLVIDTTGKSNTILLFPDWLKDFGNYRIETSAAMISSSDASRWFSICFRYSSSTYMHMCVRKNMANPGGEKTTGGIECVLYNGGWKYLRSAGYDQNMEYGTYYKFGVDIFDNTVQYTVDDSVVLHIDDMKSYYTDVPSAGLVGIQGNSSVMHFDYVKIVLNESAPVKPEVKDPMIAVEHGATNLLNAVTNVAVVNSADLEALLENEIKPNSILVKYESAVTTENMDALYALCNEKGVIPGVFVKDQADADVIVGWCSKNDFWDINIASENAEVLKAIRTKKTVLRTVLYLTDTADMTAQQLREVVRKCAANVLMLPSALCSKALVSDIQELHVTLWAYGEQISKTDAAWMISSGANGVVSNDPALVHKVMTEVYGKNTLTKTPSIIGHRGNPSQAPENSIEGYITAVQNGATEVETDIYLTKDGEIIIMHDSTLNRTTNYTGTQSVTNMTLEEIRQYKLLNKDGTVSDAPVPTLKEMFEALADYDVYYVIELKSGDENMVEPLYDLIKEFNVAHRVNIISFSGPVLTKTYQTDPIISAGYLSGSLTAGADDMEALRINAFQLIKSAQLYNATVNVNFGTISKEFYTMLSDRGITMWPWTFTAGTSMAFYNSFLWGVDGLTTDDAQLTKNTVMDFDIDFSGKKTVLPGETFLLKATTTTYGGTVADVTADVNVTWITNEIGAAFDPETGTFTASETEGTASFMVSYSTRLPNGKKYVLYSQPVTVDVVAPENDSIFGENTVKYVCIGITAVCLVASVLILVLGKKKKA